MNNYASIIKYFRNKRDLSLNACAENICSKNYLHMIEKGTRTPSFEILDKLCFKLKIDFEDFANVLQSTYPIESYYFQKTINELTLDFQFDHLYNYIDTIQNEKWINQYPIREEILLIKAHRAILHNKNVPNAEKFLKSFFKIEELNHNNIAKKFAFAPVNFKALNLSIFYYIYVKDLQSASNIINFVKDPIESVKHLKKYTMIYVGYNLLRIDYYNKQENYQMVLKLTDALKKYQVLNNNLKWLDQTYYFSARANFLLKNKNLAIDAINKAVQLASILNHETLMIKYEKFKLSLLDDIIPD